MIFTSVNTDLSATLAWSQGSERVAERITSDAGSQVIDSFGAMVGEMRYKP